MCERDFQINVERQLNNIIPNYNETIKFPSDTLFHFINKAKDEYVKQNFRVFQRNQEITDNIRTLVNTKDYTTYNFSKLGNKWEASYPEDYMFALGENVYISIKDNKCNNLITHESDVIEATIETVSSRLSNSLSDHKLRYNQAKPIRVYTDNKIVLYTDGNYDISSYQLTYLSWGTPKYEEPIYAHPLMRDPVYILGEDMSQHHFSLFKMDADTTYYPVFDLVHAVQPANIGSEDLKASLKRVVTGLKEVIKDKNNGILSSSIDSMVVRITNIAGELNFYTAAPQGSPRTVAFPLVRSVDGTQMSNATVMLFPSFGKPEFQMSIILKNGNVKSFKQTLNGPLEANSKLTLTLTLGDIFSEESSGEFTLDNWNEESQTIDVPSLD